MSERNFCIAVDIANFAGDLKLFLCVAYWIHLIHIQLRTLGLRESTQGVHKLDGFPHCVDAAAIEEQTVRRLPWTKKFWEKESVWRLPQFLLPGKMVWWIRISHPDRVKSCVDPNDRIKLRAIRNSFCYKLISVGYHQPFQHNELFHLPYMAVAEITLGRISLRVRPEEPFLLLKYILTLSPILCSYY